LGQRIVKSVALKFGKEHYNYSFPAGVNELNVLDPDFDIDKKKFRQNLEEVLPGEQKSFNRIAIIVSDKTRLCGYPLYLPWLLEILHDKGALQDNIFFFIAYGTHARQSDQESLAAYGDTYKKYRFIHHDCDDEDALQELGTTSRGTRVTVRKDILDSSLILTFGAISHHYFAGYGGGRKLFFPGLAGRSAVYHNHGLYLDRSNKRLEPGCQPGSLRENPLAEDLREIYEMLPAHIEIHGILNTLGEVCQLYVGADYGDFLRACDIHDYFYRSKNRDLFDLVVASAGGYPKDINFIQSHKAVHHAASFVADGGRLILLAECLDQIGSKYFLPYFEAGGFDKAFTALAASYEGNGGTALSMMTKTQRINIFLVTSLDENLCRLLQVTKISPSQVQDLIDSEKGKIAFIRNASMIFR